MTDAAQPVIGRLALAGEFVLNSERGVLLRPKRGDVSERYLELLAGEGYALVVVDGGSYPSFYAREQEALVPVRALPVADRSHFPSAGVLGAWGQLIHAAARHGDAAKLGVAQMVAHLDGDEVFGPDLVRTAGGVPVSRLGGEESVAAEPLRTAAALLAGFRLRPNAPDELARLVVALSSLLPDKGQFSGLTESVAPLVRAHQLGARRLLVSGGAGAEIAALFGAEGTILLPAELRLLEPLLERLLPSVERVFADFLQSNLDRSYDGAIVVPPFGRQLSGAQLDRFELSKRGGKARGRVPAELLFIEHALAAMSRGALLVTVLPEGLLSSAGQADFRKWLLEHARLLAVVSLPAGTCFRGTGVKCSVVILRKPAPADDYPILMIDVEAHDLRDDISAAQSKLDGFLEREVTACA
ncbi:N-6 DNA methylase [Nocardia brasiliensis]|uniref:N-6 DNA methylase n=1 Tax=Nocardia brasiliensis TaxID=37326 RepID=UPI001893A579|nr:N-6 DNA methylase [Nocardia brasiliensis]MBF6125058.1 SAM-dependent DNA methyltransferase [Nocardia brasiliensis]